MYSGVPGEIRGTEYVHNKHGALPWAHIIKPSIDIARHGFKVTEDLISTIKQTNPNNFLTEDPAWAIDFAPKGRLVRLGETMTRKRYADTHWRRLPITVLMRFTLALLPMLPFAHRK